MSFDHNPFRHVELVQPKENVDLWQWHCHGCGAGWNRPSQPITKAHLLIADFHAHLYSSHELTPDKVKDWSLGV